MAVYVFFDTCPKHVDRCGAKHICLFDSVHKDGMCLHAPAMHVMLMTMVRTPYTLTPVQGQLPGQLQG